MNQNLLIDKKLIDILKNFDSSGYIFIEGNRNKIKLFDYNELKINIKAFKIPNFFNKIVYKYFRESKAKRSFNYANALTEKGINTPRPIAFYEEFSWIGLEKSYYISEHLQYDLMFRDLVENDTYPDAENIIKQFTAFCYNLHQKGVEFLDHSPGNTLIKKINDTTYSFYLVDLNRMNFLEEMSFESRMKNLSRLTSKKKMVEQIAMEYSKISGGNEIVVFDTLWKYTSEFQYKYFRKKRIKKAFKF
jgi:tRNA A-37 threonylcarbamoyl transferase component Bud32